MEQEKLQIKNKLEDYISIIDDEAASLISESLVKVCKKYSSNFEVSKIIGDGKTEKPDKKIRDAYVWPIGRTMDDMVDIHWSQYILFLLRRSLNFYKQNTKENLDVNISDLSILKYEKGGHYKIHSDHHRTQPRTLSLIMFVNDDYKGGNLEFHLPDESNIHIVEKKKGRIVIFPSNFLYRHKVQPVQEGTRYSVVGWML